MSYRIWSVTIQLFALCAFALVGELSYAEKTIAGKPTRSDEITIISPSLNLEQGKIQSFFEKIREPQASGQVDFTSGGPQKTMLQCDPFSIEINGSMQYAMRCMIDFDFTASKPLGVSVNLRVFDGNEFWRSCNIEMDLANDLLPGDGAQLISQQINSKCNNIRAGWSDLINGQALIDIQSIESALLCVQDVPVFEDSCSQFSWVAISN